MAKRTADDFDSMFAALEKEVVTRSFLASCCTLTVDPIPWQQSAAKKPMVMQTQVSGPAAAASVHARIHYAALSDVRTYLAATTRCC